MSNPYEMKPRPFKNWLEPKDEDIWAIAHQFGVQLCQRYGIGTLSKIDEANKTTRPENDSVYDFIDATEFFQEFVNACNALGYNFHNPHYVLVFHKLRDDGYVYWGDNYGD